MRQQRGIDRIVLRLVQIRTDDTLLQVVQHAVLDRSAERPERLLVQARPHLLIGFPNDLAEGLAGILQRHAEQIRPTVLAVAIERGCALTEVNLRLFPRAALEYIKTLRLARFERAHEALHRVIAMGEPEPLDQVLVNTLGVAAELHLILDPGAVLFAG